MGPLSTADPRANRAIPSATPPPCTPVRVVGGKGGRPKGTPHSAPPRGTGYAAPTNGGHINAWPEPWSDEALVAAWAECDEVRRNLAARERDLLRREAAAHRAEARNRAAAQQLDDLRRRLDDYSEELQEGVSSLAAQKSKLREERRQTVELQARARRICAAAV